MADRNYAITSPVINYSHPVTLYFIFIASGLKTWKYLEGQNIKDAEMTEKITADQCQDLTQSLTIKLPCQIFERVERFKSCPSSHRSAREPQSRFSEVIF